MAFLLLDSDDSAPGSARTPRYVAAPLDADSHSETLRSDHLQARRRLEQDADAARTRCESAAADWLLRAVASVALATASALLDVWPGLLLFGAVAVYCGVIVSRNIRFVVTAQDRHQRARVDLDRHYQRLRAISSGDDRRAAARAESARERYRRLWRAFREEAGGFDLYLAEFARTLPDGLSGPFMARLRSEFEFYVDFLRLALVDDEEGNSVPMLVAFQRRQAEDEAAGRPVTLRDFRALQARRAFHQHADDDDVARFIAARAVDALPAVRKAVE